MSVSRRLQWDQMRIDSRKRLDDGDHMSLGSTMKFVQTADSESPLHLSLPRDVSSVENNANAELERSGEEVGALAMLQLALAEEKRRNIAAEQRALSHEQTIKELRAENARLVAASGCSSCALCEAPREQTTERELQEELRESRQRAQTLESQLAESAAALERSSKAVVAQEERIRQLEHTIADEFIHRRYEHSAGDVSRRISAAPLSRFHSLPNAPSAQSAQSVRRAPLVPSVRHSSAPRERSLLRVSPDPARATARPARPASARPKPRPKPKAESERERERERESAREREPHALRSVRRPPAAEALAQPQLHAQAAARARAQANALALGGRSASLRRSRPRIHSSADCAPSMRATTTVVTRSAKRRESPLHMALSPEEGAAGATAKELLVPEEFAMRTNRSKPILYVQEVDARVSMKQDE